MDRVAFWTIVVGILLGAAGVTMDVFTEHWEYPTPTTAVFVTPLKVPGTITTLLGVVLVIAGIALTFSRRANLYSHKCAECGRDFRDRHHLSEHGLDGLELCSRECAGRVMERKRVAELRTSIDLAPYAPDRFAKGRELSSLFSMKIAA